MDHSQAQGESFILFELAGTTYGAPSRLVKQMEMVEQITPVPNASPYLDGVVFSRGQVIPAINLRSRFGFEKVPYDIRTRLIVIQIGDAGTDRFANRTVGLIADTAREFLSIPQEAIQPPPEAISSDQDKYLMGIATVGDRLILILNIEELLRLTPTTISPSLNSHLPPSSTLSTL